MRKQRQRTGEQRSMRMVRHTCLEEKRDVIQKQRGGFKYKKTKLSITFLILAFLTIHLGDHGAVNVLISLILRESVHHLSLREIVIHSNGSVAPAQLAPYEQSTNANYTRKHRRNLPYMS
jgi:hypothetical protein